MVTASVAQARHFTADFGSRTMSLTSTKERMSVSTYQMLDLLQAPSSEPQTHDSFKIWNNVLWSADHSSPSLHQEIVPVV